MGRAGKVQKLHHVYGRSSALQPLRLIEGEGALEQHTSAQALGVLAAKLQQKYGPSRMTSTNLAIRMGPNLLSSAEEDRFPLVQATRKGEVQQRWSQVKLRAAGEAASADLILTPGEQDFINSALTSVFLGGPFSLIALLKLTYFEDESRGEKEEDSTPKNRPSIEAFKTWKLAIYVQLGYWSKG
ncbi:hypothetical protein HGM15179_012440 [Zosterops borbonicus]|uniref:Uncharacterized protein n=1 Tax=Zosterops borbonicus TaxID=364589 RepID=A0A8K1G9U4_9PASS|nr:hypothetical protein HGM15179_012440 [Zosterops borbonicus]